MSEWTRVVTDPLGVVGFALFLIFALVARLTREERRWLAPLAAVMAVGALAGGITLAYLKTARLPVVPPVQPSSSKEVSRQQPYEVKQITIGQGSPAVQGVRGNVTITVDQNSGKTVTTTPSDTKPEKKAQ